MRIEPDYFENIFGTMATPLVFGPQELFRLGEMLGISIEPKKSFASGTWCEIENITIQFRLKSCLIYIVVMYRVFNNENHQQ